MEEYSFGDEIKRARIRRGLSIEQVSDALRIRRDVLEALENNEFGQLPAWGFIRNQVSAYARFLGLDSAEVTMRFFKEYDRYQRYRERERSGELARTDVQRSGYRRTHRNEDTLHLDSGYDSRSPHMQRQAYAAARRGNKQQGGKTLMRNTQRSTMRNRNSRNSRHRRLPRPLIIGSFLVIFFAVLIVIVALTKCSSTPVGNAPNVPNTGLAEVQAQKEAEEAAAAAAALAAQQARTISGVKTVVVSIPDGQTTYAEVTIDGTIKVADTVTGPQEYTFDVSQEALIVFATPGVGAVTVNGQTVAMTESNGIEKLTVTAGTTTDATKTSISASNAT